MVFNTFNRTIYFALETTEGTFAAPNVSTGYLEVIEPTWTVSPRMIDRNPTRQSVTPTLMHAPGVSSAVPSSVAEISFTVEMSGSGTLGTAPRWGTLLKACGFEAADGLADDNTTADTDRALRVASIGNLQAGAAAPDPAVLFHKENMSAATPATTYASGDRIGRVIGDTHYDDRKVYFVKAGATGTSTNNDNIVGEVSTNYGLASGSDAASGVAYFPTSNTKLGSGGYSSLSFVVDLDGAGTTLQLKGCRGNVEIVMTAGDRCLLNFTFSGVLHKYEEATGYGASPSAEARPVPPSFIGAQMGLGDAYYGAANAVSYTDSIFHTVTLNMGNSIVVRENADSTNGYKAAYITSRQPTMTFNPDAVLAASFDYWDQFISGNVSRMRLNWGSVAGNQFAMRMPHLQFTGVADGNRDEVVVYDSTTLLTGGDTGSSVQQAFDATAASGDTNMNARMGRDNEIVLYAL